MELDASATEPFPSIGGNDLDSYNVRADPDAQATVTDFLDFTEYLPSDITRSLTLIGQLDEAYVNASEKVHELTDLWGNLPSTVPDSRPAAAPLRANISSNLKQGLNSRIYAHAEAVRMAENVNRHYFRAKTILAKLQKMLETYPEAEQQQQEQQQQKQQQQKQREQEQQLQQQQQLQSRGPGGQKLKKAGTTRVRRQRIPRITVPGEVLAPYELDCDAFTESDVSSPSSDDESPPPMRRMATPGTQPRIKMVKSAAGAGMSSLIPKTPKIRIPRAPRMPGQPYISTSSALAKLKPPPENAVIGSTDAPWLQLTPYELAKLRKRMKKNAQWTPSETMIARELKALGRNLDAFNNAKQKAEDEGRPFDGLLPESTAESDGVSRLPLGALSVTVARTADDNYATNRGVRLNEAKKQKNHWAQLASQEAEESTRKMMEAARAMLSPYDGPPATSATPGAPGVPGAPGAPSTAAEAAGVNRSGNKSVRATTPAGAQQQHVTNPSRKRKRDGHPELADTVEGVDATVETPGGSGPASQRQLPKRVKTETPVPIPHPVLGSVPTSDSLVTAHPHPSQLRHSTTPVPAPVWGGQQDSASNLPPVSSQSTTMSSPLSSSGSASVSALGSVTTTTVPLKPPAETPIHPPVHKTATPIHPPLRELRMRDTAQKDQNQHEFGDDEDEASSRRASRASSRALTPGAPASLLSGTLLPSMETSSARRPSSRGASVSLSGQHDASQQSLATERPRRASTARNTPVPEAARPVSRRGKRPAPGVVSQTNSGGSAAVGQRKAAPRKKRNSNASAQHRRDKSEGQQADGDGEVEVDDDGNVIDPNEPRYCVCNRVSFGTMIRCDNVDVSAHTHTHT